jgi:hemerythrin superfamily protein
MMMGALRPTIGTGRLLPGCHDTQSAGRDIMATAQSKTTKTKTKARSGRTRRTAKRDPLAVTLLKKDHREVEGWFDEFDQLEAEDEKLALFQKIAVALKVHTQIEEEIFYPESRGEVDDDLLDEAYVEHDSAKKMIAGIEAMKPSDEFYDAKVKVLGEYVKHHVKEEEQPGGLFAQAKKSGEDLESMGERLKARKEELMTKMGGKMH